MTAEHAIFCSAQITSDHDSGTAGSCGHSRKRLCCHRRKPLLHAGFGIGDAATTLCGQAYGARRYGLVRRFAYLSTYMGMILMAVMGLVMFVFAPDDVHHVAGGSNH